MARLEQRLYETYATHTGWKSLATGEAIPAWKELRPEIKEAWGAVAAFVNFYWRREVAPRYEPFDL